MTRVRHVHEVPYGADPDQHLVWHGPADAAAVAVLVHGGFYQTRWTAGLMDRASADLARRGWRVANLEYRRPDRHGWEATVVDLDTAVRIVADEAGPRPLVLIGHSAGGQLVLQAAEAAHARTSGRCAPLAVSLAGVVDLAEAYRRSMGDDAVRVALGGGPDELPDRYRQASPIEFPARRCSWLLVQGLDDAPELVEMNRRLAATPALAGVEHLEATGDHFSVIDPDAGIWARTIDRIGAILGIGPLTAAASPSPTLPPPSPASSSPPATSLSPPLSALGSPIPSSPSGSSPPGSPVPVPPPAAEPHPRDLGDPAPERASFAFPLHRGRPVAYLAANALGLASHQARTSALTELDRWETLAHDGHFDGDRGWAVLPELVRPSLARLVGALPEETLAANGLSVNLHLLMASFFRPDGRRRKILMEADAFPSDIFAVRSHLHWHGLGDDALVTVAPRPGEATLRTEDLVATIAEHAETVALVFLGGVNYRTGELLDIPAVTAAAREAGCAIGWDLAHAAGNVELALHDWDVDWAAWCGYKYLNGGPGSTAGLFVHARHHGRADLPRLAGWYGQPASERFGAHREIRAAADAAAWQISNPAVFALAPLVGSLEMFDRAGMAALAARNRRLSAYLEDRLTPLVAGGVVEQLTPADPRRRGAQLSYRIPGRRSDQVVRTMHEDAGVVADARTPDIVRLAPAALYSSYADCDRAVEALTSALAG